MWKKNSVLNTRISYLDRNSNRITVGSIPSMLGTTFYNTENTELFKDI